MIQESSAAVWGYSMTRRMGTRERWRMRTFKIASQLEARSCGWSCPVLARFPEEFPHLSYYDIALHSPENYITKRIGAAGGDLPNGSPLIYTGKCIQMISHRQAVRTTGHICFGSTHLILERVTGDWVDPM